MMLDFYLLIPCYNNAEGLILSLRSVVYPKEKYKVLIVDDGSKIPVTKELLPEDILQQHQIEIIRLNENKGITDALNTGLQLIHQKKNARFIARLDCGDTCTNDRFQQQVEYLSVNTHIFLIGSYCLFVDRARKQQFLYTAALEHKAIMKQMHLKCSFIHPTVMFRTTVLDTVGYYPVQYPSAEDYAFFFAIVQQHPTAILPYVLTETEISSQGISATRRRQQIQSKQLIIQQYGSIPHLKIAGLLKQFLSSLLPYNFLHFVKKRLYSK